MTQVTIYRKEIISAFVGGILLGILIFAALDIAQDKVTELGCGERCIHEAINTISDGINTAKLTKRYNTVPICMDGGEIVSLSDLSTNDTATITFKCSGEICSNIDMGEQSFRTNRNTKFMAKILCDTTSDKDDCEVTITDFDGS